MKTVISALFISSLLIISCFLVPCSGRADKETVVVFVNSNVAVSTLSVDEVKRIFLKVRSSLRDGTRAVPVNAKAGSALRKIFDEKVLGMSETEEIKYWQDAQIKKGITPPAEFSNTQRAVFSLGGGIGYCFESDHIATVNKVVLKL